MGLFQDDPTMAGTEPTPGPVLDPSVGLPPALLGGALGPAPMPPPPVAPPTLPQDGHASKLVQLALLGLAAGLGPRRGGGLPEGIVHSTVQRAAEQQRQLALDQQVAKQQQAQNEQNFKLAQQDYEKKQATLQQALGGIAKDVSTIPDKATYDARIDGYANILQASGYRLDSNWLRRAVPYAAPSAKATAQKAVDALFKNPMTAKQLTANPDAVMNSSISIDLNGDGVDEVVPLKRVMDVAGVSPLADDKGQIIGTGPNTAGSEFQVALNAKIANFKAENRRDPTPKELDQIVTAARTTPKAPAAAGTGGDPASGALTDEGVEYAATQYRVTGVMPPLGMGKTPMRAAIINKAAEQARILGQSPANAIQKQAAYKSDGAALTKMRSMSSAAESFETKAVAQADIVDELSQKVPRTSWPVVNDALIAGKTRIAGDESATLLLNAIQTFSSEYAKIMEGSTGSAAGSSDSARAASQRLISAGMSRKTVSGVLNLMRREMQLTVDGYGATIDHITQRMGGPPPPVDPNQPTPETWVRDKNGKLVKQ